MKLLKANTDIICNKCHNLKIVKRKVMNEKYVYRNTKVLYCTAFSGDVFIDSIDTLNQDLHSKRMPDVKAIFECPKRQALRTKHLENQFELQIS